MPGGCGTRWAAADTPGRFVPYQSSSRGKSGSRLGLFIGLTGVYVADFFASLGIGGVSTLGTRLLGFFHIGTGVWLMYLMFAVVLNFVFKYTLPV